MLSYIVRRSAFADALAKALSSPAPVAIPVADSALLRSHYDFARDHVCFRRKEQRALRTPIVASFWDIP